MSTEASKLQRSTLLYLIPNLLVRGASFLLTPLYAWTMSPADFAVLGIAATIHALVGSGLSLGLHGSIPRMHFEYPDEDARRRYYGTVLVFYVTVPVLLTAIVHGVGAAGGFDFVRTVPFSPHLELVLWSSLLGIFPSVPTAMFMAREEPGKVAALNAFAALAQVGLSLLFVLVLRQGPIGVLRATLVAAAATTVVSLLAMRRHATPAVDVEGLRASLRYCLPLVPHFMANWALAVSDRLILDWLRVPAQDIGVYSLAYYGCLAVAMFAGAVSSALSPICLRLLKADPRDPQVPVLGWHAMLAIVTVGMITTVFAPEALRLFIPTAYQGASTLMPWLVAGAVFQGAYMVNSIGTWFSMRTGAIPMVTAAAAVVSVTVTIVLVPRFGVMAAAVSTAAGYAVAALLHGWLASKLHPIPWGYSRWIRMMCAAIVSGGVASAAAAVAIPESPWSSAALKAGVLAVTYPGALIGMRVTSRGELESIVRGLLTRFARRRGA